MKGNPFFDIDPEQVAELSKRRVAEAKEKKGRSTIPLLDTVDREALISTGADIWTRASVKVSKAAEITLEEISHIIGLPYRKNGLEINATWNTAMTALGMCLASLPEGWESQLEGKEPDEALLAILKAIEDKLSK